MRRLAIAVLSAAALAAQTVDRTRPPETPPLTPYKLPAVEEAKLANGLTVLVVRDTRFPLVTLRLGFPAGSKFDPPGLAGLAETAASLLKEGAGGRTSRLIAEELASIGGQLDAGVSPDNLVLRGGALSEHTGRLLEIAADIVQRAAFPEEEVSLRKQNREQELAVARAESATLAEEKLHQVVFGGHPYSRFLPTDESIRKIARKDLLEFRDRFLAPNGATLVLVGAAPEAKALRALVEKHFGAWKQRPLPAAPKAEFPTPRRTLVLVDRPGSAQADIHAGQLSVPRSHPDHFPLLVAANILGGGTSSRMFRNIREKEGFAYDVHAGHQPRGDRGLFSAVTQVRDEVVEPALQAVLKEMDTLGKAPVEAAELSAVKNYLNGVFVLQLENQAGLAEQLVSLRLQNLPRDYLETYVTRVRSVEPDQIQAAARKYMSPEKTAIVVVGDAAKIEKQIGKFGKPVVEKAK